MPTSQGGVESGKQNKIYDVISIEKKWYRVIDDSGEDYIYSPEQFEVVDDDNEGVIVIDNAILNEEAKNYEQS